MSHLYVLLLSFHVCVFSSPVVCVFSPVVVFIFFLLLLFLFFSSPCCFCFSSCCFCFFSCCFFLVNLFVGSGSFSLTSSHSSPPHSFHTRSVVPFILLFLFLFLFFLQLSRFSPFICFWFAAPLPTRSVDFPPPP